MRITLPAVYVRNESIRGNTIQQLAVPRRTTAGTFTTVGAKKDGRYAIAVAEPLLNVDLITADAKAPKDATFVLRQRAFTIPLNATHVDVSAAAWVRHPMIKKRHATAGERSPADAACKSWSGAFTYRREDMANEITGLRPPQIGALFAVQSHFAVHRDCATVVMPTGTGKTETMLSVLVAERIPRLLVVVPTDPLRTQLADKFQSFGLLKDFGVISEQAHFPVVGVLRHGLSTLKEIDEFVRECNVVVTTMALIGGWKESHRRRFASHFGHVFVDEAHHSAAPSWQSFLGLLSDALVVQFTATPYRNDGKPVGGVPIFNYPLRQAQKDGYFKPINFRAITEFNPKEHDKAIADAAVAQLKADAPKRHILMARVNSVRRAEEVFSIYEAYPEFHPVQIHTGIKSAAEREIIRQQILSRHSRIVVCVDMLGEGFDLPELKIAAFHDIRHSLPITLQLAGRFTRSRADLGEASIIANIAHVEVQDELRDLYQHDVDWNQLLPLKSDNAIAGEFDLWEFLSGFKKFPKELSLQNVRPAMSAVAYRTSCKNWDPENFKSGIPRIGRMERVYHDINAQEDTLVILTAKQVPLEWAKIDDIFSWDWQLYVLIWDRQQRLLFIHNSSNSGFFKELAQAVCGAGVEQVRGPTIFRCLAAVNRLRLNNVGLLEQLGRLVSYTMRAGADVESGMTQVQKQRAIKANLFGTGFENGHRTTIGCSYKGRIWSRQTTNLLELKRWCKSVGTNLIDASLDPETVLNGTLEPEIVTDRPTVMPLGIDWPDEFYRDTHVSTVFRFGTQESFFHEVDLSLHEQDEESELRLEIASEHDRVVIGLELFQDATGKDYRFVARNGHAQIRRGNLDQDVAAFLTENPPTFWFADGSSLAGNQLVRLKTRPDPYPRDKIDAWSWQGVNLKRESQGIAKAKNSIQYRVLQELKKRRVTVLFDDDDQGEAADVVSIREGTSLIEVELYHCKYSGSVAAGSRVADLYVVCGQAQRSVRWMESPASLFTHLLQREPRRSGGRTHTRFEVGTESDVLRIRERSRRTRVSLRIFVVQPGLSKMAISLSQLELLGVTETYLKETFLVPFGVIASP